MVDMEEFKKRLVSRRAELVERMNKIDDLLEEPVDPDVEERATERELDDVYEEQGNVDREEVMAIDAALKRMENGVFGTCISCGEPISEARLEAVPYATKCQNCMG